MSDSQPSSVTPMRPWQEIAEQLAHEHDSVRILALSQELMRALDLVQENKRNSA